METIVIVGHVLAAITITGLILLQQGKGADMGASFGAGASQTLFGSQGSGNFFSRMTALIAVVFFATSVTLAVIAKEKTMVGEDIGIPMMEERDVPTVDEPAQPQGDVPAVEAPGPSAAEVPTVEETGEQSAPEAAADPAAEMEATEVPQPEQ